MEEPTRQPVHRCEVLALCLTAVAIIASCIADSQRRLFWGDEVFTALVVSDESLGHMLAGLKDEINAMPPLYFVLGWLWVRIFGASELSLRLPSAFCVVVGIVAIWAALRRVTNRCPATFCAIVVSLLVAGVRHNICEARCYGLYFAAYAVAVALYVHCADKRDRALSFYICVALVHGVLVAVHYVGGLFSAVVVAAALLFGRVEGDGRFLRYAMSAAMGWLAVIPSLPFLLAQRKVSTQYSWVAVPQIGDLLSQFAGDIAHFHLVALLLLLAWLVAEWIDDSGLRETRVWRGGRDTGHVAVLMAMTIAFLPAVWLESRWGARIFIARYLFLASVAWILAIGGVYGYLFERLWWPRRTAASQPTSGPVPPADRERWMRVMGRALVCVTAGVLAVGMCAKLAGGRPTTVSAALESDLAAVREHPNVPVMACNSGDFVCLAHYLRPDKRVFLLIDEWIADSPTDVRCAAALKRHYFPDSMRNLDKILVDYDHFLIVGGSGALSQSLLSATAWEGREITDRVWLWRRR